MAVKPAIERSVTLFDLIATVVVLLSVLAGFSNGAVREVVGLCAFGLAVVGALLLLPFSGPMAHAVVHPNWASSAVAVVAAFLVIYIGLQMAGRFLTARLRGSGLLGGVDRLAGGGIGLLRAAIILGAFYLVYQTATPAGFRPGWIDRAALFPLAAAAGRTLEAIAPKSVAAAGRLGPSLTNALAGPEQGAGVSFGADGRKDDLSEEPTASARSAPRGTSAVARHQPPREGLDVVLEHPR